MSSQENTGRTVAKKDALLHPAIKEILQQYPGAHLLLPSQTYLTNIGQMQKVSCEVVFIEPSPAKKQVYPIPGQDKIKCDCQSGSPGVHKDSCKMWEQKVAFNAGTFERLARASAISYHPSSCYTLDEKTRCAYKVIAMLRNPDGTWSTESFDKSLDLDVLAAKFDALYRKKIGGQYGAKAHYEKKGWKWPGDDAWVKTRVDRDLLQKQEYMRELVQTGAKKRAVQHYLGLQSHYTRRDLLNPFVAVRIDFSPDLTDKDTKMFLLEQGTASAAKMYPGSRRPRGEEVTVMSPDEVKPEDLGQDYEGLLKPNDIPPPEVNPEPSPEEVRVLELEAMDDDSKQDILVGLMRRINYDLIKDPEGIGEEWKMGSKAVAVQQMEALVNKVQGGDKE